MTDEIVAITDSDISKAWGKVLLTAMSPGDRLRPMCVSITGFGDEGPSEVHEIREALDKLLSEDDKTFSTKITSETIFPYTHWSRKKPSRQELYATYLEKFLPRYRRQTPRKKKGTYFERLINFSGYAKDSAGLIVPKSINQLEHIITVWNHYKEIGRSPAHAKLQASCFDPNKDHDASPYLEFPCLQQVGFSYSTDGLLAVTGYYTTQYIISRAYGNYLGLYHLGIFMAKEMGLKLSKINCFTANPKLDRNKSSLRQLQAIANSYI